MHATGTLLCVATFPMVLVCGTFAGEPTAAPVPARWNVKDAGGAGDGNTDHTALFQRLLDEAGKAGGGVVDVPAGRYVIKGTLSVPAGVTLQGIFRVPPTIQRDAARELSGSVLLAYAGRGQEQGVPFIRLAGNNGEFVGRWGSKDAVCLEVGPRAVGKVSLVNCSFWGPIDRCVWMRSPVGQFTAIACNFVNWDVRAAGAPAIQLDAGRAIVQGCTFAQEGPHVQVEEPVASALLIGNQASGGFVAENRAGKRTQLSANESSPVEWTAEARKHYRVAIGTEGDGPHLRRWHGRERTMRWSTAESQLKLPVAPGDPYTLTLELSVPKAAVSQDAGLYQDGKRIAALESGATTLTAELPPSCAEQLTLTVICAGWIPSRLDPASRDDRTLGVQLSEITMRAKSAGTRVFQANTGEWK